MLLNTPETMGSIKMSTLPPLKIRFDVEGISEPPERSWARIRTYLIDTPRDEGLPRRQEVWSYHRKHRGVLKSIVRNIPNVPYRVRRVKQSRKYRNGIELRSEDIRNQFQIGSEKHLAKNNRLRPLGAVGTLTKDDTDITEQCKLKRSTDTDSVTNDSVTDVTKQALPPIQNIRSNQSDALKKSKRLSYSMNDLPQDSGGAITPVSDSSSVVSDGIIGNYGPSSQSVIQPSIPKSLLDILNGNNNIHPRLLTEINRNTPIASIQTKQTVTISAGKTTSTHVFPGSDLERLLENVVGEKEVIDVSTYDNFARAPRVKPEENRLAVVNTVNSEKRRGVPITVNSSRIISEIPTERKIVKTQIEPPVQKRPLSLTERIQAVGHATVNRMPPLSPIPQGNVEQSAPPILPRTNSRRVPPVSNTTHIDPPINQHPDKAVLSHPHPDKGASVHPHPDKGASIHPHPDKAASVHPHPDKAVLSPSHPDKMASANPHPDKSVSVTPPVCTSPNLIGERIAPSPKMAQSPTVPRYFPIFSRDGPLRKIGGPPKSKRSSLKITFPHSVPDDTIRE